MWCYASLLVDEREGWGNVCWIWKLVWQWRNFFLIGRCLRWIVDYEWEGDEGITWRIVSMRFYVWWKREKEILSIEAEYVAVLVHSDCVVMSFASVLSWEVGRWLVHGRWLFIFLIFFFNKHYLLLLLVSEITKSSNL